MPSGGGRSAQRPGNYASLLHATAIGVFAFLLYANTLGHGYVLDDDIVTRRNAFVQQGTAGLNAIFTHGFTFGFNGVNSGYRPLGLASLALETQLFGNSAAAHHAVNVIIFSLLSGLLYLLLAGLPVSGSSRSVTDTKLARFVPLAAALLFAAHPIHTEVVANIKSRDELLSFFFGIVSLLLLVRHIDSGSRLAWGASVLGYFLAALSKETGLAVVGLVPLTIWFFRPAGLRRLLLVTAPYLAMAGVYLLLRQIYTSTGADADSRNIINNALVAAPTAGIWLASRIAILGRYLLLLAVPYPLSYDYSYNQVPLVGPADPGFIISMVVLILLVAVAVRGFPRRHVLSYAICFYAIMLALVSNLVVPVGTVMAERLVFASSAGFCLAIAWLLARSGARPGAARLPIVGLTMVVTVYTALTVARNRDWRDQASLLSSGLRTSPRSARVQNHYGTWLRQRGEALPAGNAERTRDLKEALKYYARALAILPTYAEASYDMGVTYYDLDDLPSARDYYRRTLQIDSLWSDPLTNLGVVYFRMAEYDSARAVWLRLTRVHPDNADAFYKVGGSYYEEARLQAQKQDFAGARERFRQAAAWLEKAYALDPAFPGSSEPLANSYRALGDSTRARQWEERSRSRTGMSPRR